MTDAENSTIHHRDIRLAPELFRVLESCITRRSIPMSATPDSVVRTWFEELWNQGKEDTMDRLFAADGIAHGLGGPLVGPDGYRPFYRAFREAFPDIHVEILRTVTEGDLITSHCRITGTHRGKTMGVPTGKAVDF